MGVALITGCSSGFGLLSALELARRGDRVFASMRNVAKAGELERRAKEEDLEVEVVTLDVTDPESVTACVDDVLALAGGIDVLVNNAGIGVIGAMEELAEDELLRCYDTNVFGVVRMVRAVLPSMREQQSGTILTISSVAGLIAPPFLGAYSGSKYAVEAMCESLYHEAEPFGVRVGLIEPGFFRTEIMNNADRTEGTSEGSPYWERTNTVLAVQTAGVQNGPDPQIVADLVADLAHAETVPLRTPVGDGTENILNTRRQLDDETFAKMLRQQYRV